MPILQAFYRIILGIPPQYFQAAFSWQPQLGLFFQQRSSQLLETLRYGKNHTRLWWAHSLQTWKKIYWHFILSARCWLATMSRCLLHVVNLLVVLYLRWWCGLWKLVCCRCSSSTASAMLPTSSTASASRNLDPPKQNYPPSESSSLWHILGGAEHFNQIFKRMFGNISDIL